jgi:ribose transport system permease protein
VPWLVIVAALVLALSHVVLTYTRFGRYVYMTGGNREAAEYSGVNVRLIVAAVMVISAVLSGIAGMLGVAHFGSAQQEEFDSFLLDSISAVVVGGTSLAGGEGRILGTLIGAFIIAVIQNGMNLTGVESYTQKVVLGLVILGAVLLDMMKKRGWKGKFPFLKGRPTRRTTELKDQAKPAAVQTTKLPTAL